MNINPDLRRFVTREVPHELPPITPVLQWVGRPYGPKDCWKFVHDAFLEVGGLKLPDNYYEATSFFTQVPDPRQPPPDVPFVPEPWDVALLRTIDRIPVLVLHPTLVIDSERIAQTWGDNGIVLSRFDDERVNFRIAAFIRLIKR